MEDKSHKQGASHSFRLYVSTGNTVLFEETQAVNVSGEKFTVLIGNATDAGVPSSLFQITSGIVITFKEAQKVVCKRPSHCKSSLLQNAHVSHSICDGCKLTPKVSAEKQVEEKDKTWFVTSAGSTRLTTCTNVAAPDSTAMGIPEASSGSAGGNRR